MVDSYSPCVDLRSVFSLVSNSSKHVTLVSIVIAVIIPQ